MKGRYLTNTILSFAKLTIFIVGIVMAVIAFKNSNSYSVQTNYNNQIIYHESFYSILSSYLILSILYWALAVSSFIMGIITLSMEKGEPRGLGIASGVVAIVPFASLFAGGVVSLMAFIKCS